MRNRNSVVVRNVSSNKYLIAIYLSRYHFLSYGDWVSDPRDAYRVSPFIGQCLVAILSSFHPTNKFECVLAPSDQKEA